MEQKHRVGETGMLYQFRVFETGVCKMGMDEIRVGETRVVETGVCKMGMDEIRVGEARTACVTILSI